MSWYNPISWFGSAGDTVKNGYQNEGPGNPPTTAAPVNFDGAMTVSAFWASTRLLSEAISSMPIKCYKNMPDGSRKEDKTYRLWRTFNYLPNGDQTRTEFFETLMLNLVSNGNAYNELTVTPRGISSFEPRMASQIQVKLDRDGKKIYEYTDLNGFKRIIPREKMWHIKLFGNSIVGMSPLQYAAKALGVSIAAENRVGKLAKNAGKSSGILTVDNILTDKQRPVIRKNMEDLSSGDSDTLKILEADMKFQHISLSPQDMQLLENRRFQLEDIARFLGVPSVLINDTAGSTVWGSGIGQIIDGFHKLNLRPYAERIESSMKRWLMPVEDWDTYDIEFDFDALLRADLQTRIETNAKAINSGQIKPNEARNLEGREDAEGGDQIYLNGTLVPAGKTAKPLTNEQRLGQLEEGAE